MIDVVTVLWKDLDDLIPSSHLADENTGTSEEEEFFTQGSFYYVIACLPLSSLAVSECFHVNA